MLKSSFMNRILIIATVAAMVWTCLCQDRHCNRAVDVAFVLYGGPEVKNKDWNSMHKLIDEVVGLLNPSEHGTHLALTYFAGQASVISELTAWQSAGPRPTDPGRNLSGAIRTQLTSVFTNKDGDRPEVPDKIVIITGGNISDNSSASVYEASVAKSHGIYIATVGIGTDPAMKQELQAVATNADETDQLIIAFANRYKVIVQLLVDMLCPQNKIEGTDGNLRLVDGNSTSGRLEVYWKGEWTTISTSNWTIANTRVACKQIGFPDGLASYYGVGSAYARRIGLTRVACSGNEAELLQCQIDEFFALGSQADHRTDVFLRCLCADCNDYVEDTKSMRLIDGNSMSGRLEVFITGTGWISLPICEWSPENTRVACRQLQFDDGAGTFENNTAGPIETLPKQFACVGNETALANCPFDELPFTRYQPVYIRCVCRTCSQTLQKLPTVQQTETGSSAKFEWVVLPNTTANDFEIWFMSSKNPQLLLATTSGIPSFENTDFKNRINLTITNESSIIFSITDVRRTDIGNYVLNMPTLKLNNGQAILFVTDFGVVPNATVLRKVNESLILTWDLTLLQQLGDVEVNASIYTPATGRIRPTYYYVYWLTDNQGLSYHPDSQLMLKTIVRTVQLLDAGTYSVELIATSPVHVWLKLASLYSTHLLVDIDECTSRPCKNGGTCVNTVNGYTCNCVAGYSGLNCEYDIDECASRPCGNCGTCVDEVNGYTCNCVEGYAGVHCETDIDECASKPCANEATCVDAVNGYTCKCAAGYSGANCEIDIDECASRPCSNGGTCINRVNGYACNCVAGYTGVNCEYDIDECASQPCGNCGKCVNGVNKYTCNCVAGYTGVKCEIDIDECASKPCANEATCVDAVNGYTCKCAAGYFGANCEIDIDECASIPCSNGGTCINRVNGYTCNCVVGYTGVNCEYDIDECASQPCGNCGKCVNGVNKYTCNCVAGYTGVNCETDIDECASKPCANEATCVDAVNGYTCKCAAGYTNVNCEINIDDCASQPCENNATCVDAVNGYTCNCVAGYTGVNCKIDIDECESLPCENNATCVDAINGYTCSCVEGYTGANCETDIDECTINPCENAGTCVDTINGYTCSCAAGYIGVNCQTEGYDSISRCNTVTAWSATVASLTAVVSLICNQNIT